MYASLNLIFTNDTARKKKRIGIDLTLATSDLFFLLLQTIFKI